MRRSENKVKYVKYLRNRCARPDSEAYMSEKHRKHNRTEQENKKGGGC